MEKWNFKKITAEDMKKYIEEKAPQDKAWFKSVAFNEKGKYQHLIAVRAFCDRYMPEILPVAKEKKAPVSDMFANW